jgi:transposase
MPIVGGLDIHRKQITFDYLDTVTGQVCRGQISPADRVHLRAWLARFAGRDDVAFALEGCAGWRYVAGELAAAGVTAHLAEPAGTAFARGRKRHAKTDSRHLRLLLAEGRLPECWIPPGHILECRALLELYNDLRRERTAQAELRGPVPPGRPGAGRGRAAHRAGRGRAAGRSSRSSVPGRAAAGRHRLGGDRCAGGPAARGAASADRRGPAPGRGEGAGRPAVRGRAGDRAGDHLLAGRGGPVLLLPPGGPVRRAGGITVSSSDRKGPPGRLSRQGPPVLRWAVYEAGKAHARTSAPDHRYYAAVKDRKNSKRACLPRARKILRQAHHILAELGDDALAAA